MSKRPSLAELRERLKKPANTGGSQFLPFWDMKTNEQMTVRFLPDANQDNPLLFVVEKLTHTLEINGERKNVPCLKMYGNDDCPICKVSAAFFKKKDKDNGLKYWRKKQYIAQVLIQEDPLPANDEGKTNEGTVRPIMLGPKIYDAVKLAIEDGELEEVPCDYENGTDFIIKKGKQGEFADYSRSKFARNPSALDPSVVEEIGEKLVDLSTLLPKEPDLEYVNDLLEQAMGGGSSKAGKQRDESDEDEDEAPAPRRQPPQRSAPADEDGDEDDDEDAAAILSRIRGRSN